MSESTHAIEVRDITKRYGDFVAVNNLSFAVPRGTIFGLLGPNGAGKTTTIRMIMDIIMPDSGSISILGQPAKIGSRRIGYLPEERGLYRKMKVLDHLVFLGEIRGLGAGEAKKRATGWLDRLGLESWASKKVEELSKGMQQKLQFVGCVIHDPEVLILDEPFSGFDPVAARLFKELLTEMRAAGKTLVLSTHVMEQAEKLCDEIGLINRSNMVLRGSLREVKEKFAENRLILTGRGDHERLGQLDGVRRVAMNNGAVDVELDPGTPPPEFLRSATQVFAVESAVPHETSLDEIFVRVVGADSLPQAEEVEA